MEPLRVLVVDDEVELVHTMVERLSLRGIKAHGETHGREALDHLLTEDYDVVLLDIRMPGVDGLEVIEVIRMRWPDVKVVILTGMSTVQMARRGRALGAYDYLVKPVQLSKVIRTLYAAAGRSAP